jgi:DNA-binding transcriptional LysR family regulator
MDIRHLQQILAIHEHGSFAKAAQALGLAQPSLSATIARIEDELKLRIFERTAKGSALTPAGEAIVERAERVIAEMRGLTRDTELMAGGEAGELRLGVGLPLRDNVLPPLLLRIAERHPNLRLLLEIGEGDRMLPKLATRELDLVMCAMRPSVTKSALVATNLLSSPTVAIAAPTHPLARERAITVARLAAFRCAITTSRAFALEAGSEEGNLSHYRTTDYAAVLPLVHAGMAVGVMSMLSAQPELAAGRVVQLDIDFDRMAEFVAVTTRAAGHAPIVAKIVGYAREIAEGLESGWTSAAAA